ncbi:MAG: sigma-70 family RNA polymerase sigma factor [Planctomycetes bacterium]|nr:sigma-70 family RNA polymerase sigma factor [Planctomycetota bacterium]
MSFRPTRWSLVLRAADDGDAGQQAMAELCATYWPPVYHYFRRTTGDRHRAEDLTQGLFERLLAKRSLAEADPLRGRFRNWLLACASHHLANVNEAERALKRGGGAVTFALDAGPEEARLAQQVPDPAERPEQAFTRRWIAAVVDRTLLVLQQEFARRGRERLFAAARPFVDLDQDPGPMREAAAAAGVHEGAFKVAVHRLRERFHEALRAELARTVDTDDDVDDELAHLLDLLRRP